MNYELINYKLDLR